MRMTLSLRETLNILHNKSDVYRIFAEYFDATAYIWLKLGFIPHINYNFAVIEYNQRILTRVPYEIVELISSFVPVENYIPTLLQLIHRRQAGFILRICPARRRLYFGSV